MDLKKLPIGIIAMVALAAIVLTGIAVTDEYGYQLRTETNTSEDGITPLVNTSVRVGSSGEYPYLQELSNCVNASDGTISLNASFYSIAEGDETGGFIILNDDGSEFNNTAVNCSTVQYLADSDAQAAADSFSAGLAIFATFSAVVALSIVGKAIIGLFKKE